MHGPIITNSLIFFLIKLELRKNGTYSRMNTPEKGIEWGTPLIAMPNLIGEALLLRVKRLPEPFFRVTSM